MNNYWTVSWSSLSTRKMCTLPTFAFICNVNILFRIWCRPYEALNVAKPWPGCTYLLCFNMKSCYHNCTTYTKPIQLSKKEFVSAFYVLTLSTNEKSSHRAAAGRKWKNKFRKSVRAVVFNPTCVSIYNLSMAWGPMSQSWFLIGYL